MPVAFKHDPPGTSSESPGLASWEIVINAVLSVDVVPVTCEDAIVDCAVEFEKLVCLGNIELAAVPCPRLAMHINQSRVAMPFDGIMKWRVQYRCKTEKEVFVHGMLHSEQNDMLGADTSRSRPGSDS